MTLAIHQPDFMPWLGFFHKLGLCERFMVFDHVQAPRGKSWHNRNRVLIGDKAVWLTVPIERKGAGFPRYHEVRINQAAWKPKKQLRSLELSYRKTAHFDATYAMFEDLYGAGHESLLDLNMHFIRAVCDGLGLRPTFLSSRALVTDKPGIDALDQNDLVLELCKGSGTADYISGTGCLDFIRPETFAQEGITFTFQRFEHPPYPQVNRRTGQFVSHLSLVDALFNHGFDGVAKLLRQAS